VESDQDKTGTMKKYILNGRSVCESPLEKEISEKEIWPVLNALKSAERIE
jgi:hypothetical protein